MNVIEKVSSSKVDDDALCNSDIEITHTLTVSKSIQIGKYKYCNDYDITKIKDFPIDKFKDKISFNILSTTNYCNNEEFVKSEKPIIFDTRKKEISIYAKEYKRRVVYIKYTGFTDPSIVAKIYFDDDKVYTLYKIDETVFHIRANRLKEPKEELLYVLKDDTLTILE